MVFLDCWVTNVLLSGGALIILTHSSQGLGSSGITHFLATWTDFIFISSPVLLAIYVYAMRIGMT